MLLLLLVLVVALLEARGAAGCTLCGDSSGASSRAGGPRAPPGTPLAAFSPAHPAEQIVNATIFQFHNTLNTTACVQHCLAQQAPQCIAFSYDPAGSSCVGSGWSPTFAVAAAPSTSAFYSLLRQANTAPVNPAIRHLRGPRRPPPLLRAHFDWFNAAENLPLFLPPAPQGRLPFGITHAQFDHGHEIYLIYQEIIHNSRPVENPNKPP